MDIITGAIIILTTTTTITITTMAVEFTETRAIRPEETFERGFPIVTPQIAIQDLDRKCLVVGVGRGE